MKNPGYHYTESGLDNVFLLNGVTRHATSCGEGVAIHDTEGLHRAIGLWLIAAPKPLRGAELRFIRLEMEQTQKDLAAILNATEQTLRLWEKHRTKPLPGVADRLLRALFEEYLLGDGSVRRMLDRLAQLREDPEARISLRETSAGWRVECVDNVA